MARIEAYITLVVREAGHWLGVKLVRHGQVVMFVAHARATLTSSHSNFGWNTVGSGLLLICAYTSDCAEMAWPILLYLFDIALNLREPVPSWVSWSYSALICGLSHWEALLHHVVCKGGHASVNASILSVNVRSTRAGRLAIFYAAAQAVQIALAHNNVLVHFLEFDHNGVHLVDSCLESLEVLGDGDNVFV